MCPVTTVQPVAGRVRRAGWSRVTRGIHRPEGVDELAAWQLVLPATGAFTGLTAARRYGWWLPPLDPDLPVFASQGRWDPRPRRAGLRITRHPAAPPSQVRAGVRLTTPGETLLSCARWLSTVDVVVLVDAALSAGDCTVKELTRIADGRRIGSPRLRAALRLADARSESPWETLLRLLHVVSGVAVVPQYEVRDEHGLFVARADLWLTGTRVLHEYDGAVHLSREAQRSDLARNRRLIDAGWVRRGYTSAEVLHQAAVILRQADSSTGRTPEAGRADRWYAAVSQSLFTPRGTALFRERLGLAPVVGGPLAQRSPVAADDQWS